MHTANLDDVAHRLAAMPDQEREGVLASALRLTSSFAWTPLPGPQMTAFFTPADVTSFGGAGGGGKSDLIIGLCLTAHRRSLIIRRQYTDLKAIIDRSLEVHGSRKGFNGASPPRLTTEDGRIIDFGACALPGSETQWQGQAHDLLAIDEAA